MSAGKNRPSRPRYRLPSHAAVISAAARAAVRYASCRWPGLGPRTGVAPGCRATPAWGSGADINRVCNRTPSPQFVA